MNPDHFSVCLCLNKDNRHWFDAIKPTLTVFNERDIRLFIGNADIFYSDVEIGDDLSTFLVSIGVSKDNQYHLDDDDCADQILRIALLNQKLALAESELALVKLVSKSFDN